MVKNYIKKYRWLQMANNKNLWVSSKLSAALSFIFNLSKKSKIFKTIDKIPVPPTTTRTIISNCKSNNKMKEFF